MLSIMCYEQSAKFITFHYEELCSRLELAIAAQHKEELAGALVHILHEHQKGQGGAGLGAAGRVDGFCWDWWDGVDGLGWDGIGGMGWDG